MQEKPNLFPLFRIKQKVTWVKHNLMELFVPGGECRHLRVRQTTPALDTQLIFIQHKTTFVVL